MVAQKSLSYGSRGRQFPAMPRIPNTVLGKRTARRKKNEICAFDLLATIAGTLLTDQDSSSNPNTSGAATSYARNRKSVKEEYFDEILPLKNMAVKKGCCSGFVAGLGGVFALPRQANDGLAENSLTRIEAESVLQSLTVKSNMLARHTSSRCTRPCEINCDLGIIREYGAVGVCHQGSSSSAEAGQTHQAEPKVIRSKADRHTAAFASFFDSLDLDCRPPPLVRHTATHNDENSSGCTHPSTTAYGSYKSNYLGNHRIKKLLASEVRKAARNKTSEGMSSKGSKLNFCWKKVPATCQKVQRTNFKRKKLARGTTPFAKGMLTGASGTSFTMEGQNKSCGSEDYHVKLRIKSFNIPELFVDIPETATIGSLKRTVMDVVTSIMEGGLRVGVLLQGKSIQDDSKTLRQAGIGHGEKLNSIDFTLECERQQDSPSADIVEPLARMKYEEPFPEARGGRGNQQPIKAYHKIHQQDSLTGCVHRSVEMASQDASASLQAIIPVAASDLNALASVPICKTRGSEIGQRRTRMPFSVGEVEALVEAVEQLGTGRWRAVKMHAFDGADHRTYVDLKDKWKTLVHTASISPQQRRGEPVPQELLDRVLSAQAYWSRQQAKLRGKAPLPEICPA
ncbi:unnamed protein product [Urochloa humidicola]